MTALVKYKQCKSWKARARVIFLFHAFMIARKPHWSMRLTASYFNISLGHVSESILLAKHLSLLGSHTRTEALEVVRNYVTYKRRMDRHVENL